MSRAKNLLEIWSLYSNHIVAEKAITKKNVKMNTKEGPGPKELNDKDAGSIAQKDKTGPDGVDNFDGPAFNKNIDDVKKMTPKQKAEKPYVANLNVSNENFDKNMEKSTKALINNNMKSTFDKLFEEVMHSEDDKDLAALGVDTEAGEGLEGGEVGGDVTVTLTHDQVECLKAILAQLEGGEGMEGEVEELGDETTPDDNLGSEEDAEEVVPEATEMKEVPDSAGEHLTKVGNNKVGDKTQKLAKKGPGDGKVTQTVDGKGKDVPDSAGLNLTKTGSNVVPSKIKGKNQELFGV